MSVLDGSDGWSCKIYRFYLCRWVRPLNECPGYDIKQSDGEAPVILELWGIRSTSLLASLPDPRWPLVAASDKVKRNYFTFKIGVMIRVFANGSGDLCSIPGRVILKTKKKWYLMPLCLTLSIIKYGSRVKWSNPGKGVGPSPTPRCSSYRKGSLRVTFDYSRQLYL